MACEHISIASFGPDSMTETELCATKQDPCVRLAVKNPCLMPPERAAQSKRTQLSPISFLPSEILIHIFQYELDQVPDSARTLPLPITMASVCKSWRATTLHTPDLWTRVFVTSAMPFEHLQTFLERSGNFDIDISFCHWPVPKYEVHANEAFLVSIISLLHRQARRLRSLSLWDVSDTAVCTITRALVMLDTPRLAAVSIKAHHTAWTHYYQLRNIYLLPFLSGRAPSLTHLDMDHFPINFMFRDRTDWPYNVQHLTSLTLRTRECSAQGFLLPQYLIEFPALCALLRATPNLKTLALYGPIIEPDEDFPMRPPGVTLPLLETLVVHRREPGIRYHCELLSVLTLPSLQRLEIPWHDDLGVELPYRDRAETYLLDEDGRPRFGSVREVYVHDSTERWRMPTRTFIKAFPNVETVVLGGKDVSNFVATLRGCDGAWKGIKKIVLKEPEMGKWKGWVRGLCKWLAAGQDGVCIEIRDVCDQFDERTRRAFRSGLERLGKYARVVVL